jgi:flavin-dependent dehydrogenase
MKISKNNPMAHKDRFAVIGGGPAGSFFASCLLREARRLKKEIEVLIIEKKFMFDKEDNRLWLKGCNFGAGGISPRLSTILEKEGFHIPAETIKGNIERIWIHGQWKNIPIKVPDQMSMVSVFRGTLPPPPDDGERGLDSFLLRKAVEEGAEVIQGDAREISYSDSSAPVLKIKLASGKEMSIPADFVAIASGINALPGRDYRENPLFRSVKRINPAFIPAKLRRALVFELKVSPEVLEKNLKNEVYFIEYGSKALPLEHIALVPKKEYLTVTVIGEFIDKAVLPRDARMIIKKILRLPQLNKILPEISDFPVACMCLPKMTVGVARNPVGEKLGLIGDAVGSRLYKDGLYSAFLSASQLARIVLNQGTDKKTLAREYGKTVKWLAMDNRYGKLVFRLIRLAFSNPFLSRILYQTFATELKIKEKNKRPLGQILWKVASGYSDYKEIFRAMFSIRVLKSVLIGGFFITLRNVISEFLFGLKWGEYGKYPTVVLKEKRAYVKESLASILDVNLNNTPDFERMYAIKIKATSNRIFEELGKFGDNRRSYMNLRSVRIRRISGEPNELDSIIRYSLKFFPVWVDMKLIQMVPNRVLFYEVSEKFAERGKLIFEIKQTEDGNNRLAIYTAYDFKKGKGVFSKIFWWVFRRIFPAFIHDVVWNHALCSIKQDAELGEDKHNNLVLNLNT